MRIAKFLLAMTAVTLVAAALAGNPAQNSLMPRAFKPPRVAVVDINEIFENYQKTIDIRSRFEAEMRVKENKFKEEQNILQKLKDELKNVQEGTERHKELTLQIQNKDYDLKNWQKKILKEFQERQINALKEIKDEIVADIERYARGLELDIVFEKQVAAGQLNQIRWPIVHYVKPELEISGDIIKRLNTQYGHIGPVQTGSSQSSSGSLPKKR